MYNSFYGFSERPFQLVPNPAYLYLSKGHEEALAHLAYAISQGDGFVEITGEVGTGKTTICRVFLDNLDVDTEAAYIFNPKIDSIGLLKSINTEFGLDSTPEDTRTLVETLNRFLLDRNARGKKVFILIDEAHLLPAEVLEQIRLLSNLETNRYKLLQIILVGQPELSQILGSRALRQLRQRITLRYALAPLTPREMTDYIRHRIQVASGRSRIPFDRGALRRIHRYSGGIPRLINIACDRSLLTGYALGRRQLNAGVVRTALQELSGQRSGKDFYRAFEIRRRRPALLAGAAVVLICVALYWLGTSGGIPTSFLKKRADDPAGPYIQPPEFASQPAVQETAVAPASKRLAGLSPTKTAHIANPRHRVAEAFLQTMNHRDSRRFAVAAAVKSWNPAADIERELDRMDDDLSYFNLAARLNGLSIQHTTAGVAFLRRLNMPAVLTLRMPGGSEPVYAFLRKIDGDFMTLAGTGNPDAVVLDVPELTRYWSGETHIPWKNFHALKGSLPFDASKEEILTLKMLLKNLNHPKIELTPFYDDSTRAAVKAIQRTFGLPEDGIAGALTLMAIYSQISGLDIPHIGANGSP